MVTPDIFLDVLQNSLMAADHIKDHLSFLASDVPQPGTTPICVCHF